LRGKKNTKTKLKNIEIIIYFLKLAPKGSRGRGGGRGKKKKKKNQKKKQKKKKKKIVKKKKTQ
jgi:hypothetical protein